MKKLLLISIFLPRLVLAQNAVEDNLWGITYNKATKIITFCDSVPKGTVMTNDVTQTSVSSQYTEGLLDHVSVYGLSYSPLLTNKEQFLTERKGKLNKGR